METLKLQKQQINNLSIRTIAIYAIAALASSISLPYLFDSNQTIGFVDAGIWQLLLIAFITWLLSLWLSITAFNWILERFDLPEICTLVKQFNKLSPWQKLKSYFFSFVLLIASVITTILAIV